MTENFPAKAMRPNCAMIAVEKAGYGFDKLYSYVIPAELIGEDLVGRRVLVSFGGGRKRQGIVFETVFCEDTSGLKFISAPIDLEPVLSQELLKLALWMKESCFCTLFEAAKAMLPTGIGFTVDASYAAAEGAETARAKLSENEKLVLQALLEAGTALKRSELLESCLLPKDSKVPEMLVKKQLAVRLEDTSRKAGDATVRMVRLTPMAQLNNKLTEKQKAVTELLSLCSTAAVGELCELAGCTEAVLTGLKKRGIIEIYKKEIYRRPKGFTLGVPQRSEITLTAEQEKAYLGLCEQYNSKKSGVDLLYGVTGSGKTLVFIKMIDKVIDDGKNAIVMVPEISLTPQTLARFRSRYGDTVAVIHSGLSMGERLDEWKRIKKGEARVVVGTRSAVFSPLENIGLIIMDEEQEYTYKSESSPRYHARDIARFRCRWHNARLLLCSATPSVESYCYALSGIYHMETITKRYGDAVLPEVNVVDISEQRLAKNVISPELQEALAENLENGRQSILLHNRRGFHTFVSCRACGKVICCDQCSVSMTYHHDIGKLVCHYCGAARPFTFTCPECGLDQLRYAGQGTQRVEEELAQLFPKARILRMDADTTTGKYSHAEKLEAFSKGEYDIMIGTQMVAKGLDFENVTLVGVLLADQMLYSDDFRSYERAFSLLTQVIGRAGRGAYVGKAMIQTTTPENLIISMASRQDYSSFYNNEIKLRKAMLYPPYSDICVLGIVSERDEAANYLAEYVFQRLKEELCGEYSDLPVKILGPCQAGIHRIGGKYRYRLILKCKNSKKLRQLLHMLLSDPKLSKDHKFAQLFIDMNPDSVM